MKRKIAIGGFLRRWLWVCAVAPGLVLAEPSVDREDGLLVGRWVVAPSLELGHTWDSNVFRGSGLEGETDSDQILRMTAEVDARTPFRNSEVRLNYKGDYRSYEEVTSVDEDVSHDLAAEVTFRMATGDELTVANEYTLGIFDVRRIDEGGELVFDGQGFTLNTWSLGLERDRPGRRAYAVAFSGSSLDFDRPEESSFFEFDGLAAEFEYREPLNDRFWLTTTLDLAEEDHFEPGTRERFRSEDTRAVQIGLRGLLAPGESFFVRVGHARSEYPSGGAEYSGSVWRATWRFPVGNRTRLDLGASRRPRSSFFFDQNFYKSEAWRARLTFRSRGRTEVGFQSRLLRARYGEPEPEDRQSFRRDGSLAIDLRRGETREDRTWTAEVFADIMLGRYHGFRVELERRSKSSNYEPAAYDATVVTLALVVGWL